MKPLDDLSPMPFGKFKGKPMQEVPAWWFHWLWTQRNARLLSAHTIAADPVLEYIKRNLAALKMEYPDGLW